MLSTTLSKLSIKTLLLSVMLVSWTTLTAQHLTGYRLSITDPSPKINLNATSAGSILDNNGTNAGWPGVIFNAFDIAGGPLTTKWNFTYSARDNELYFYDYSNSRVPLALKDNGNVIFKPYGQIGIATDQPSAQLHVYNPLSSKVIYAQSGGTNAGIGISSTVKNYELWTSNSIANNGFGIYDRSSLVYRIAIDGANGNVGIGTTAPSNYGGWQKVLDVRGDNHSKILATTNTGAVRVGLFSHGTDWNGIVGRVGTETNHDLRLMAGYGNDYVTIKTNGNVGIGTINPNGLFEIQGPYTGKSQLIINTTQSNGELRFSDNGVTKGFVWYDKSYNHMAFGRGSVNNSIFINSGGQVGVGTVTMGNHKLAVEGTISAREIKVEAAPWPDYVFFKNYDLITLEETESFIKKEGHLPNIPSSAEVKEYGISLGEMNAKLLEKIEELTLHLINQNRKMEEIKKELENLNSK